MEIDQVCTTDQTLFYLQSANHILKHVDMISLLLLVSDKLIRNPTAGNVIELLDDSDGEGMDMDVDMDMDMDAGVSGQSMHGVTEHGKTSPRAKKVP